MYYNVILRRLRRGKEMCYVLCVCLCVCVYVFVAVRIQHAMRMRHIFIYGVPDSAIFFHIIS